MCAAQLHLNGEHRKFAGGATFLEPDKVPLQALMMLEACSTISSSPARLISSTYLAVKQVGL